MRTTLEIRDEINAAQLDHHEKSPTSTPTEERDRSDRIKALRRELSDTIVEGGNKCPDCENAPVGVMHDAPRGGGFEYEVGCGLCKDHRGARCASRPAAVLAWNDGPSSWVVPRQKPPEVIPAEAAQE